MSPEGENKTQASLFFFPSEYPEICRDMPLMAWPQSADQKSPTSPTSFLRGGPRPRPSKEDRVGSTFNIDLEAGG